MSDTLECFGVEYTNVAGFKATDDNDNVLTYIRPQGNKAITANGTDIDVAAFATASVAVPETTFIVTVAFNEYNERFECDKTYSEIQTAYNAGKTIAVVASPAVSVAADGAWNASNSVFDYWVRLYVDATPAKIREQNYHLSSTGYTIVEDIFYIATPTQTITITQSGNTDVTNYATASVAAGTAGTPTASKGTVSNHSVTVTPSVTNSTGWITGSTKTGTGVTVSASELVSGSETKTANGTYDVTNLASVVVNVSGSSKNTQVVQSTTRVTSTSLTGCSGTITVAKTGTYNIYWSTMRSSTSGTWSSQMYVGTTAYGSEQTTWSNHVQNVHLTNVSLTANQTVRVYAKSRGSNYYAYVPTFVIVEA